MFTVLPYEAPWKGFGPLFCVTPLADSVGSADGSLGISCSLVVVICISILGTFSGLIYGGGNWPQRLRNFSRRFPIGSLSWAPPPNAIVPCSMTGGSAAPTVAWSGRPCPWGSLPLASPQYIFHAPYPPSGRGRHWVIRWGLGPHRSVSGRAP